MRGGGIRRVHVRWPLRGAQARRAILFFWLSHTLAVDPSRACANGAPHGTTADPATRYGSPPVADSLVSDANASTRGTRHSLIAEPPPPQPPQAPPPQKRVGTQKQLRVGHVHLADAADGGKARVFRHDEHLDGRAEGDATAADAPHPRWARVAPPPAAAAAAAAVQDGGARHGQAECPPLRVADAELRRVPNGGRRDAGGAAEAAAEQRRVAARGAEARVGHRRVEGGREGGEGGEKGQRKQPANAGGGRGG